MKLILSTICVVLLVLFAYQVMSYPMNIDDDNLNKALDSKFAESIDYELPKLAVLKDIQQYSEIVLRPLFDKDRTGSVQTRSVDRVTSVNELSHLILVGTARSPEVQIGIIADTKAKQMERLRVGEIYQDWKIAEVAPDYVLFQNAELEHKLFVTPIEGSRKDKQAKLISKLNKSKIDRAAAAINSYQKLADGETVVDTNQDRSISGRSWGYNKKHKPANKASKDNKDDKEKAYKKSVTRSPIKIPTEEEKDSKYYEGYDDENDLDREERDVAEKEISAEDFYDDEDITEDELKALEALGAKIFDD